MEKLFKRHFEAIKKRGLISDKTSIGDFIKKMKEELKEVEEKQIYFGSDYEDELIHEIVDLMMVCSNCIKRYGYDLKQELEINTKHQETRKD